MRIFELKNIKGFFSNCIDKTDWITRVCIISNSAQVVKNEKSNRITF